MPDRTVALLRYPEHIHPDSQAGEACRLLAAGHTLTEVVSATEPAVDLPDSWPAWYPALLLHFAAIHARELHTIGVDTPGVTAEDIAVVLDGPRPRCEKPTRAGRPCARTVPIQGMPCHSHEDRGGVYTLATPVTSVTLSRCEGSERLESFESFPETDTEDGSSDAS